MGSSYDAGGFQGQPIFLFLKCHLVASCASAVSYGLGSRMTGWASPGNSHDDSLWYSYNCDLHETSPFVPGVFVAVKINQRDKLKIADTCSCLLCPRSGHL